MVAITRITSIKNHRIFKDFRWDNTLPDFRRFNLILGWNGSGKSTLSKLFRHIEKGQQLIEGEVKFKINNEEVLGSEFNSRLLPKIYVFNEDFVENNIFKSTSSAINPIFFLGEDSIEKQENIQNLKIKLKSLEEKLANKEIEHSTERSNFEKSCADYAKRIKETLSSSGTNTYNYYDKADFKNSCNKALQNNNTSVLGDADKQALQKQKDANLKDKISCLDIANSNLKEIKNDVTSLLETTVLSKVIDNLVENPSLAVWIQEGLKFHTEENLSNSCHFCGNELRSERIEQLQNHFNDQYNQFIASLKDKIVELKAIKNSLDNETPPKSAFYEYLVEDYSKEVEVISNQVEQYKVYIDSLIDLLNVKQLKPFEKLALKSELPDLTVLMTSITKVNTYIDKHNSDSDNFVNAVNSAREKLENYYIAEALGDYSEKMNHIEVSKSEIIELKADIGYLHSEIHKIEADIITHRLPIEQLNEDLNHYLNHPELKFAIEGNGYIINRNNFPATNLSEGEKTAIAFLYFLKTLKDKDCEIENAIVVIDDPVSSLDSNSIFCAFGYLKERTKEAYQLFILTHNSVFFQQVKNWFHNENRNKKKESKKIASFYMISTRMKSGVRSSSIIELDKLLYEYESDYHYQFKLIYECANCSSQNLEQFYGLPNIARCLLETFLAFRYPNITGGHKLSLQINQTSIDQAKKIKIIRFLHSFSHSDKINHNESNLSIFSETPQILKDLLFLIEQEDKEHFNKMKDLVL